jgi:group I intron endonuclease
MKFNIAAEHKNASGVYIIRNSVNSKVYVGSAVKLWKRYQSHTSGLRKKSHINKHLLAHSDKYGAGTLSMELLTLCEREKLLDTEQIYLDSFNACNPEFGFNKVPNAHYNGTHLGNTAAKGRKRGPEEIAKQVASRRAGAGYGVSVEQRQHQATIRLGITPTNAHTPEAQVKRIASRLANNGGRYLSLNAVAKSAATRTGSTRPAEVKAKISASLKGIERSPEEIAKQVASRRAGAGYGVSEERRAAMSKARKGIKLSQETKEKMSKARKGRVVSEETRQKIREAHKGKVITPEQRAKISATLKAKELKPRWTPEQIAKRKATIAAKRDAQQIITF